MKHRYHWTGRAEFHGKRLVKAGIMPTPSLIGQLARHEGADITVAATKDFSETLGNTFQAYYTDPGYPGHANPCNNRCCNE